MGNLLDRGRRTVGVRFDIADYMAHTDRLRWDDIDIDAFRDQPLDDDTLRTIEYMHDVELHTICYLRDLLVTPAHTDPEVTTFLSCWAYEELWHGEVLGEVLAAHGRRSGPERVGPLRKRLGVRDRVRPYVSAFGSAAVRRAARRPAHDVGCGQRVDDASRRTPASPNGPAIPC